MPSGGTNVPPDYPDTSSSFLPPRARESGRAAVSLLRGVPDEGPVARSSSRSAAVSDVRLARTLTRTCQGARCRTEKGLPELRNIAHQRCAWQRTLLPTVRALPPDAPAVIRRRFPTNALEHSSEIGRVMKA